MFLFVTFSRFDLVCFFFLFCSFFVTFSWFDLVCYLFLFLSCLLPFPGLILFVTFSRFDLVCYLFMFCSCLLPFYVLILFVTFSCIVLLCYLFPCFSLTWALVSLARIFAASRQDSSGFLFFSFPSFFTKTSPRFNISRRNRSTLSSFELPPVLSVFSISVTFLPANNEGFVKKRFSRNCVEVILTFSSELPIINKLNIFAKSFYKLGFPLLKHLEFHV